MSAGGPSVGRPGSPEGTAGRFSVMFAAVWLAFLVGPAVDAWDRVGEPVVALSYLALATFAVTYVAVFVALKRRRDNLERSLPPGQAWAGLGVLVVCAVLVCLGWGQSGAGTWIFVTATIAIALEGAAAVVLIPLVAASVLLASAALPGWEVDSQTPMLILAGGFVLWGVKATLARNVDLLTMRAENDRLLVEQERNRFARDLHDILGHSLTVIAVKAELAGRLFDSDPARAAAEVADLERLSREALADVRRAVQGYREITLPGELARAKVALLSSGIEAHLPSSTEDVSGSLRELFAWTIREAATNVVRHSRARSCTIEMTAEAVRVRNDNGEELGAEDWTRGTGLRGLRERAEGVGAVMTVGIVDGEFVLEVRGSATPGTSASVPARAAGEEEVVGS